MKIAMVSEHASPLAVVGGVDAGGQNVHVAALAEQLARTGDEVVVHTRRDNPDLPPRVQLAPGVVVDHVDAGPARKVPKDELLPWMDDFAADLRRSWNADRPDVVHSHFWMSGKAALAAAGSLTLPVAHTFHALGVVKRRHQGAADTSPPTRLAHERRIIAEADHLIATCTDEMAELEALGADMARVSVVPCGVDLDHFTPVGPSEPRDGRLARLLTVGRLVERKGVDDVIRALAHLPQAELVVAGGPDVASVDADPQARRLRDLARRIGVDDRVDLRGRVNRDDLPALLRSAELVVCAPWYEPFGIVPLEAMACGVPVVGTAVGGLLDTIVVGQTGELVPPRQPGALADAIGGLLDRPERLHALGRAGARRARRHYGWPGIAARTRTAYQRMVGVPASLVEAVAQ